MLRMREEAMQRAEEEAVQRVKAQHLLVMQQLRQQASPYPWARWFPFSALWNQVEGEQEEEEEEAGV